MSYDIRITKNGETVHALSKHEITGGTYTLGGTSELYLNMTFNYADILVEVLCEEGIDFLHGKRVGETLNKLFEARNKLQYDNPENYWECTPGNVRKALDNLLKLAILCEDNEAIWEVGK